MNNIMTIENSGSDYQFSAIEVDRLGASEYTLVTLVLDMSSSVMNFSKELNDSIKMIIDSCKMSSFAENVMVRLLTFNDKVYEEHGFLPLSELNEDSYKNVVNPKGMTALFDATLNSINATISYGEKLYDNDFDTNGILFIVTDGMDNRSKNSIKEVENEIKNFQTNEAVESLKTVLIGVNTNSGNVSDYLEDFKKKANIDQYIDIKNATSENLAKMASFISKSISAQSQALGSGVASKSLSF